MNKTGQSVVDSQRNVLTLEKLTVKKKRLSFIVGSLFGDYNLQKKIEDCL